VSVAELIELVCVEMERKPPTLSEPGTLPEDHPAQVFAPYFDVETRFDDRRGRELAAECGPVPDPASYLPQLLDYSRRARWGKTPLTREAARELAGVMPA
jgi:hypothetical protein